VNQVQQVAVVQYVQFVPVPIVPIGSAAPVPAPASRRVATRRASTSLTALTDPNNPWGFDFPPTPLVK
jgi:hypothetical protein